MPCRYLLDTNICIYIRQRKSKFLLDRFESLAAGEAAISIITYGELHFGAEKSAEPELGRQKLRNLSTALPVLPLLVEAGFHYGVIRAFLERRGEKISGNDLWIAAHAMAAGLVLVTNNAREFRRVPRLDVENWSASGA